MKHIPLSFTRRGIVTAPAEDSCRSPSQVEIAFTLETINPGDCAISTLRRDGARGEEDENEKNALLRYRCCGRPLSFSSRAFLRSSFGSSSIDLRRDSMALSYCPSFA